MHAQKIIVLFTARYQYLEETCISYFILFLLFFYQAGNFPPQDAFSQVHKQAEVKRALKMYSVISDGEDGRSRSPSPLENNNDLPSTPLFEKER